MSDGHPLDESIPVTKDFAVSTPVIRGGEVVQIPLEPGAAHALNQYFEDHREELDAVLLPFNIKSTDVVRPDWQRVLREGIDR